MVTLVSRQIQFIWKFTFQNSWSVQYLLSHNCVLPFWYSQETFLYKKISELSLIRAAFFEDMTAAPLQWNHDDGVDFMKEEYCLLAILPEWLQHHYNETMMMVWILWRRNSPFGKSPEWLIVAIMLNFLWPIMSLSSVTGTVRVGVQEILLI